MDKLLFIAWFVSPVFLMLSCKIANIGQKPASDSSKSQSQTQKGSNECLFNTDTHYANFRDFKKIQSLTVSQGWKPVSDTVGKLMSLDTVCFFFFYTQKWSR